LLRLRRGEHDLLRDLREDGEERARDPSPVERVRDPAREDAELLSDEEELELDLFTLAGGCISPVT